MPAATDLLKTDTDALSVIQQSVIDNVPEADRGNVQALIVEELQRLHEGVLARYGLRPSEFTVWKAGHYPGDANE